MLFHDNDYKILTVSFISSRDARTLCGNELVPADVVKVYHGTSIYFVNINQFDKSRLHR